MNRISLTRDFKILKNKEPFSYGLEEIKQKLKSLLKQSLTIKNHEVVYIENISANPVSILHLGNLIQGVKTDIMARLYGFEYTHYYVNDLGSNFCKFISNYKKYYPQIDLKKLYTYEDPPVEELELIRSEIFNKLDPVSIKARDDILKLIQLQLEEINFLKSKYIYESDFRFVAKELIESLKDNQINGIRVCRDDKSPLYICTDYCYRRYINQLYPNGLKLISSGYDHKLYDYQINRLFGGQNTNWQSLSNSKITYENKTFSKRNNNCLDLQQCYQLVRNTMDLDLQELIAYLKLLVIKYENRSVIDLSLKSKDVKEILKLINFLKNTPVKVNLEELFLQIDAIKEKDEIIQILVNYEHLMTYVAETKSLNKIYKFLELLFVKRKNNVSNQNIINQILKRILQQLGFIKT